jgi:hypothetical protein
MGCYKKHYPSGAFEFQPYVSLCHSRHSRSYGWTINIWWNASQKLQSKLVPMKRLTKNKKMWDHAKIWNAKVSWKIVHLTHYFEVAPIFSQKTMRCFFIAPLQVSKFNLSLYTTLKLWSETWRDQMQACNGTRVLQQMQDFLES